MIGTVEAQNELGGYRELSYVCELEKYGKQYVPQSVYVK